MITTIGDFLVKAEEYSRLYKDKKHTKSKSCVMNAQLFAIEHSEDYEKSKKEIYTTAMNNCDLYMDALKLLNDYVSNLTDEEREFVVYAGERLSSDDIAYFSFQADIGKYVEITKENVENFVEDVKELGYQSFRYNEALNFVGTKETFEKMFEDFYEIFKEKVKKVKNSDENK